MRTRARRLLIARAAATVLVAAILGLLGLILLDFVLRIPPVIRGALLAGGVFGLGVLVARLLVPAVRFRPTLTQIALRVERHQAAQRGAGEDAGQVQDLSGLLASGVDLATEPEDLDPTARLLRRRVLERAAQRFDARRAASVVTARRAAAAGGVLAGAVVLCGAIAAASPTLAGIGVRRALTPWEDVRWPRRQTVVDVTGLEVHPSDTAVALRGAITATNRGVGRTPVWAEYRLVTPEGGSATRRVMLTGQGRAVAAGEKRGELYERLVEPSALAEGGAAGGVVGGVGRAGTGEDAETFLEYRLLTEDDWTERRRIRLVDPPALVAASLEVTLPEYAQRTIGDAARGALVAGTLDLGAGADERSVVGPILAESFVRLRIELNKPLPEIEGLDPLARLRAAAAMPDAEVSADGRAITVSGTLRDPLRLPLEIEDEFGLGMRDEVVFTLEARADAEPAVAVAEPRSDESVLPSAVVPLVGEASDDLGVRRVWLERQTARPVPGSDARTPEPAEDPEAIAERSLIDGSGRLPPEARVAVDLDLSPLGLAPGDEVWVRAAALDAFEDAGGERAPVRSGARRLRIIDETELAEQIRGELNGIRRAAQRLDEQQAEIARALDEAGEDAPTGEFAARQSGLTDRLAAQLEQLGRVRRRQEMNRLDDPALADLLRQAGDLMAQAAERARTAAESLAAPQGARAPAERVELAEEAQRDVRDRLNQLVGLLDRGEEGWRTRQLLERLAEEQRRLLERTESVGAETVGRDAASLTPEQRGELERIAERQREAADRTRRSLEEMREAADRSREQDPALSEALRRAAQRLQQSRVAEQQEQAAQQVGQNQTSQAQQQQQRALEELEQALADLDEAQNNRDAALRRLLASLIESIDGLIRQQEGEIGRLGAAQGAFAGLAESMIRVHQNTLGVADEAAAALPEVRSVADLIGRAADAQAEAVVALRASPVEGDRALERENTALERLRRAKEEAERLDREAQQREQDRAREELRRVYQAALEMQVAARAAAAPYAERDRLDRRARAELRGVADQQRAVAAELERIRTQTRGLTESGVFDLAHRRMESDANTAAESLGRGEAGAAVAMRMQAVEETLRELVAALTRRPQNEQEFDQQQAGGGSGGGAQGGEQGPLVPPLAELRLLRALQAQVAAATRLAAENGAQTGPAELQLLGDAQRALAAEAADLIRRMNQASGGGAPGGLPIPEPGSGAGPTPEPEAAGEAGDDSSVGEGEPGAPAGRPAEEASGVSGPAEAGE